ncbi:FAD-dependent monooxygenase [Oricola sp.]|uniref:FAD-dependent monooxygenase n=1 Tax=Oricola sp. TaxID=1979950 RepID=UPI0025F81AA7|nr:FAD-dependent monooxygenase [Oricola sp.]MCI5076947.1 FAD-dependent monooxygenase [Oricola sp.]
MKTTQVAIVGGGPVGLGLAIDLGQRGIDVVVLEKYKTIHRIPKGQNLTQRTGEHFQAWGIYEAMKQAVRIPSQFGTGGLTAYGTLLGEYHYDWLIRSDVRSFYAADNLRLPQYDLEGTLRERVAMLDNVETRYGDTVEAIRDAGDGVVLQVANGTDGTRELRAEYVIGCDGARSMVRESAKLPQSLKSHFRRMVLAVFRSDELNTLLERYPGKSYFNVLSPEKEGYWQFFGRVELGTWFFHTTVPEDSTVETIDLGAHLAKAIGQEIAFETEYLGFWDLRIAIADTYRNDRIFIAGDAAHSHPPYGGYGVNNGFEDVRNLAWKLEARLKGYGTEALLDSYSTERQPVFTSTADDFIVRMIESDRDFVAQFTPDTDRAAFEAEWARRAELTKRDVDHYCPNYAGSPVVTGGTGSSSAVGAHLHSARPGFLLPPKDDVTERLGSGFNLVTVGDQADAVAAFRSEADRLGIPLNVVEMPATDGTTAWDASLILLRPDRFVAACGADLDAADVLGRAIGRG